MTTRKPNIILLVLDTQRIDRMSIYGYPKSTTPNLDALGEQSTVFEWGIAPAPWTIPSHASMFTGTYPSIHQTTEYFHSLPDAIPTLAELLAKAGYETVGFCNNPLISLLETGLRRGFNRFYNYSAIFREKPHVSSKCISRNLGARTQALLKKILSPVDRHVGKSAFLFELAFIPIVVPIWMRLFGSKGRTRQSLRDAVAYLQYHSAHRPTKPLFMFINLMETHLPYYPPRQIVDEWLPYFKQDREVQKFIHNFNRQCYRWIAPLSLMEPFTEIQQTALDDMYDAEVAYQDSELRCLLDYLMHSNHNEDTAIVVVSDHGEGLGDHDFFGHIFVVYNELVHIPLMIRYPAMFPPGLRHERSVSMRRIYPTLLEVAGICHEANGSLPELSLAHSMDGNEEYDVVVAEAFPQQFAVQMIKKNNPEAIEKYRLDMTRRAIFRGNKKLITVGGESAELFELREDPNEEQNLLDRPEGSDRGFFEMERKLREFIDIATATRDGVTSGSSADRSEDPELLERLRDLGYIE